MDWKGIGAVVTGACALLACSHGKEEPRLFTPVATHVDERFATPENPVEPLPLVMHTDPAKVALGARLFAEPAVSGDGKTACTTCHDSARAGTDGRKVSPGPFASVGMVNTPTVFNLAFCSKLTWAAKFGTFEGHLDALIKNPRAVASTWEATAERLRHTSDYAPAFAAVYREGLTPETMRDAFVELERSLITPGARFDQWLSGDEGALDPVELEGWRRFKVLGCVSCHQGINLGCNLTQKIGVMHDFFGLQGRAPNEADLGLFAVTHVEADRYVFRVASLRNVALTAPYFHDGSAETLEDAVRIMGEVQLGRRLAEDDVRHLVAFLKTHMPEAPRGTGP